MQLAQQPDLHFSGAQAVYPLLLQILRSERIEHEKDTDPRTGALLEHGGHRVGDGTRLGVIHLYGDRALSRAQVLPELWKRAVAVKHLLHAVAARQMEAGVQLHCPGEKRVCHGRRTTLVADGDDGFHGRAARE